jgi:hypothetical protein
MALSYINLNDYNLTIEQLATLKFPNKKISGAEFPKTVGDYFGFINDLKNHYDTYGDLLTAVNQYSKNTSNNEKKKYAGDFQPWARQLSQFIKSYKEVDRMPNISRAGNRNVPGYVGSDYEKYKTFFTNEIVHLLEGLEKKDVLTAINKIYTFLNGSKGGKTKYKSRKNKMNRRRKTIKI